MSVATVTALCGLVWLARPPVLAAQGAVEMRLGGFAPPNLPSPVLRVVDFNIDEGARTDAEGRVIHLSASAPASSAQCPYRVLVHWDAVQPAVEAAPFYPTTPEDRRPSEKYPVIQDAIYFRVPVITNPGFKYVNAPSYNSYIYLRNCRDEYSNALPFRIHPTALQLHSIVQRQGVIAGQSVGIRGSGLAGASQTDQRVVFFFRFGRTKPGDGGVEYVERTFDATPHSQDERFVAAYAPSVQASGYTRDQYFLEQTKVYVVRGNTQSNALPLRYCSSAGLAANSGSCW